MGSKNIKFGVCLEVRSTSMECCIVILRKNSLAVNSFLEWRIRYLIYSYVSIMGIFGMPIIVFNASVWIFVLYSDEISKRNDRCSEKKNG